MRDTNSQKPANTAGNTTTAGGTPTVIAGTRIATGMITTTITRRTRTEQKERLARLVKSSGCKRLLYAEGKRFYAG